MGATLTTCYEGFLADAEHLDHLRRHTLCAYRYELALASANPRFAGDLDALSLADLETWIARPPASPSTVSRRAATFPRFFGWASRHALCQRDPLAGHASTRTRRRLPRPIQEVRDRRALDAALATTPQPYRLIFTLLRETGMRVGEVLALRRGDVTLDEGREALRVREPKNGAERVVVLGPDGNAEIAPGLVHPGSKRFAMPPRTSCAPFRAWHGRLVRRTAIFHHLGARKDVERTEQLLTALG